MAGHPLALVTGSTDDMMQALVPVVLEKLQDVAVDVVSNGRTEAVTQLTDEVKKLESQTDRMLREASFPASMDTLPLNCASIAQMALADALGEDVDVSVAEGRVAELSSEISTRSSALSTVAASLATAVGNARAALNSAREERYRQLKQQYIRDKLTVARLPASEFYTHTIKFRVSNTGDIAVTNFTPALFFRGKQVPRTIHHASSVDPKPDGKTRYGEYKKGLAPGEAVVCSRWGCGVYFVYGSDAKRVGEKIGLPLGDQSAARALKVKIIDADLSGARERTEKTSGLWGDYVNFKGQDLATVFKGRVKDSSLKGHTELAQAESREKEGLEGLRQKREELAQLREGFSRVSAPLDECKALNDSHGKLGRKKVKLAGMGDEVTGEDEDVRDMVRKMLSGELLAADASEYERAMHALRRLGAAFGDGSEFNLAREVDDALTTYLKNNLAETVRTGIDGSYAVEDLKRGRYIIISDLERRKEELSWVLDVEVKGATRIDLSNHNMREGQSLELLHDDIIRNAAEVYGVGKRD